MAPLVGILMGSESDWPTMKLAADVLREYEVPFEARVLSAHRTGALRSLGEPAGVGYVYLAISDPLSDALWRRLSTSGCAGSSRPA